MRWFRSVSTFGIVAIALGGVLGCGAFSVSQSSRTSEVLRSPARSVAPPAATETDQSPLTASESDLWSRIRQGKGYVILFRHALAPGTGDPPNFRLNDCTTQRNLSTEGRQQAIRMGEVLRQHNISVSRVLSSQWCRCLETARLMNLGQVEPFPVLNSFFQDRSTEREQTDRLQQFILENQDNPEVTIMVTHQVNITAISNIVPQSGAAVVMRSSSSGQIEVVGQLDAR